MSSKLFPTLATVAVALAGAFATSAMAVEATQYVPEHGNLTRAEVKSATTANGGARVVHHGEATAFVDQPAAAKQGPVLAFAAEGQTATARVVHLGEATVFVDAPSVRSRAEVRNETLAAIQAARRH
jgi:hypothetical protein